MKIAQLLQFRFLPASPDAGLLLLRVWLGLSLLLLHGWGKVAGFSEMAGKFPDPLGIGTTPSLILSAFAEAFCSALVVLGLFTRAASAVLIINMGTAFLMVHKTVLKGPAAGELAFVYLAGWVALLLAGAGRYSVDARLGAGTK